MRSSSSAHGGLLQVNNLPRSYCCWNLCRSLCRSADKVFAQGDTGWFVPTLRNLTRGLVSLAFRVGSSNFSKTIDPY